MRGVLLCAFLQLFVCHGSADTVALWLFDEPVGVHPGAVLKDAGPNGYSLILGRGAEIVPGKSGNALRPVPPMQPRRADTLPQQSDNAHFAALFTNGDEPLRRASFANPTDTKLNLGAHDWTIECRLRLDPDGHEEGLIFEIGAGPRGEGELATRFAVAPRENAFVLSGLAPVTDASAGAIGRRVEFPNPEGPPGGIALLHSTTLVLHDFPLPRGEWFHVALVHAEAARELRLFVNGKSRAVAVSSLMSVPRGEEAYVSVGRDGRCQRPLPGALDELRISDSADYASEFTPPAGRSREALRRVRYDRRRDEPVPRLSTIATVSPRLRLFCRSLLAGDFQRLARHGGTGSPAGSVRIPFQSIACKQAPTMGCQNSRDDRYR